MDLRHLRYFIAVAEELHFGRAVARLHIAQPALSIQIRALEDSLGGRLFHRNNRTVVLTEAGHLFLREARLVIEQADRAVSIARRALKGETGRLTIAHSGSSAHSGLLGKTVRTFRGNYPDVDIQLVELDPRRQIHALMNRQIDGGFTTTLALDVPLGMTVIRLAMWPLLVGLAENHPLAGQEEIPLSLLRHEPFVGYADASDDMAAAFHALAGFIPDTLHKAPDLMTVLTLVGAGMGIALLPASLRETAVHFGVRMVPISGLKREVDSSFAYRRDEDEPAMRAFLACISTICSP